MLCVTFYPDRNPALNILYNFNLQNRVTCIFKQTNFLETIVLHNINNIDGNLTDATQINSD